MRWNSMIYKVLPRQQQVLQKWETAIPSEPTIGRSPRALIDDMGTPRHAFIGEFVEIGLRDARLYLTLFSVLGDVGDCSGVVARPDRADWSGGSSCASLFASCSVAAVAAGNHLLAHRHLNCRIGSGRPILITEFFRVYNRRTPKLPEAPRCDRGRGSPW